MLGPEAVLISQCPLLENSLYVHIYVIFCASLWRVLYDLSMVAVLNRIGHNAYVCVRQHWILLEVCYVVTSYDYKCKCIVRISVHIVCTV